MVLYYIVLCCVVFGLLDMLEEEELGWGWVGVVWWGG